MAKHGKDFQTISKLLSDKTEAQVKTYFNTHKKSLFEQSLSEFNKKKKVRFMILIFYHKLLLQNKNKLLSVHMYFILNFNLLIYFAFTCLLVHNLDTFINRELKEGKREVSLRIIKLLLIRQSKQIKVTRDELMIKRFAIKKY